MPLFTWKNKLLAVGKQLAAGIKCCCSSSTSSENGQDPGPLSITELDNFYEIYENHKRNIK